MTKKKHNYFLILLTLIFVAYLALYMAEQNGYYDYQNYNKKVLTEEAMKKFEEDVAKGMDVTVESYLVDTYNDYSNGMSRIGLKISESASKMMKKGINKTFGALNTLFAE